jgi:hypothetical protein
LFMAAVFLPAVRAVQFSGDGGQLTEVCVP